MPPPPKSKPIRVSAFTSAYNRLSKVLVNEVQIARPFNPHQKENPPTDLCRFHAIWDTGASGTVITQKVVDECGLIATGMAKVYTASGEENVPTYLISLMMPNRVGVTQLRVSLGKISGNAEVLIGMDIIGTGDFAVSNFNGKTIFSFRFPSVESIDFIPKEPNKSGYHKVGRNQPCPCGSGKKYKKCCGK